MTDKPKILSDRIPFEGTVYNPILHDAGAGAEQLRVFNKYFMPPPKEAQRVLEKFWGDNPCHRPLKYFARSEEEEALIDKIISEMTLYHKNSISLAPKVSHPVDPLAGWVDDTFFKAATQKAP